MEQVKNKCVKYYIDGKLVSETKYNKEEQIMHKLKNRLTKD